MRDIVTSFLDGVGFGLLTLAGFLIATWLGFAVLGAAVLFTSWKLA